MIGLSPLGQEGKLHYSFVFVLEPFPEGAAHLGKEGDGGVGPHLLLGDDVSGGEIEAKHEEIFLESCRHHGWSGSRLTLSNRFVFLQSSK